MLSIRHQEILCIWSFEILGSLASVPQAPTKQHGVIFEVVDVSFNDTGSQSIIIDRVDGRVSKVTNKPIIGRIGAICRALEMMA